MTLTDSRQVETYQLDTLPISAIQLPLNGPRISTSVIVGITLALTCLSPIAYALSATLIAHHPLTAIILTPNDVFITLGASRVFLLTMLACATVRLSLGVPLQYELGKRAASPGTKRPVKMFRRPRNWITEQHHKVSGVVNWLIARINFGRYGLLLVFLFPSAKTMIPAGAYHLPRLPVVMASVAGKVVRLVAVYYLGAMIPLSALLQQCLVHLRP